MKIKLRLYKYHDPELVEIYRIQSVNFEKLALSCLRAFVQKETIHYEIKKEGTLRPAKRVHQVTLKIDEAKDKDVVTLLKKANDGCMNAFIKTILKWYLSSPMPLVLIKNKEDSAYFQTRYSSKLFWNDILISEGELGEVNPGAVLDKSVKERKKESEKKEPVHETEREESAISEKNNEEIEALSVREPLPERNLPGMEQKEASDQDIAQMFLAITQM